jgi:hypothetical protein
MSVTTRPGSGIVVEVVVVVGAGITTSGLTVVLVVPEGTCTRVVEVAGAVTTATSVVVVAGVLTTATSVVVVTTSVPGGILDVVVVELEVVVVELVVVVVTTGATGVALRLTDSIGLPSPLLSTRIFTA